MKEGWEYKELGEITTSINGLWKGKKEPFVRVGVIRNANFTKDITLDFSKIEYLDVEEKQYKNRKLQKGDLIVEKSGGSEKQPVGRTVLFNSEGEFSVSNFTSILRINNQNEITPEFLYKYLLYIYKEGKTKEMQKATTGIHNIIYDKFLAILIPILSLAEQQQIVSFLDSEFENIDALKANAEKQLQAAKDLFQKALKEMLTPKEGWEEKKFDTIFDTVTDFVAAGSFADLRKNVVYNDSPDYAQLVRTTDLKNQFRNGGFVYVSQSAYNYLWRVKLNEECIVLPNVGVNCGEVYFINPKSLPYSNNVLGPNAILVRSSLFDNHFLSLLLQGQEAQYKLKGITSTMAQPKYNKTNLKTLYLHIPSNTEQQQRIAAHLDALSAKVKQLQENYNETITLCNDLKQSLLKKVFE